MYSARVLARRALAAAFHVAAQLRACAWISDQVVIPDSVGALEPGPMDTSRVPPLEGLYDLLEQRHVHFFTLAKSARVGGTLFCIAYLIYRLVTQPGPKMWVDPSRSSMRQLFRRELEAYLLACQLLKSQAIQDREKWNPSQCFFRSGAYLKMAGAGSPAELAGFNGQDAIINEGDKVGHTIKGEAPTRELAIVRTKQFHRTRKILENSTPTDKFGPTWRSFLKGSQHHAYLPCPYCSSTGDQLAGMTPGFQPEEQPAPGRSPLSYDPGLRGWQRLTFFHEDREVPFDENLQPFPDVRTTRQERTGRFAFSHCRLTERKEVEPEKFEDVAVGWDYDRVAAETRYECAHCHKEIPHRLLPWMLRRYWWVAHHAKAPRDHVSAHFWAAYSPFEEWGGIARKFLLADGDQGALHDVYNSDFGLPFNPAHTEVVEEDIQKIVKGSPQYLLRSFPYEPEILTTTVDVQRKIEAPYWFMTCAWGVLWDLPGWPTFLSVTDYGRAMSQDHIEELTGIRPDRDGNWNRYRWRDPANLERVREYQTLAGLIDSGDQAQQDAAIYDFCLRNGTMFNPSKGGGIHQTRGDVVRLSPVYGDRLQLVWYYDQYWKQRLYHHVIKARRFHLFLPSNLESEFFEQLTDERTAPTKNGNLEWVGRDGKSKPTNNHLADCLKLQLVLSGQIEQQLDLLREQRLAIEEAASTTAIRGAF